MPDGLTEIALSSRRHEADSSGRIYCDVRGEVLPTGITWEPFASRGDITDEEFDRVRRYLDARGRALYG